MENDIFTFMLIILGIIGFLTLLFWLKFKNDLKNNIDKFIGLALLGLFVIWGSFKLNKDKKDLKKNLMITIAEVQDIKNFPGGSGLYVHFGFSNKDKYFTNKEHLFSPKNEFFVKKILKGKKLIVAFDKKNPDNNKLFLTNSDFKEFNIVKPDSLQYIYFRLDSLGKIK